MTDFTWSAVRLAGEPRLVVGRRPRPRELDGVRVDLHEDTFNDLRSITQYAISTLFETVARPYEPFAELEEGEEHFEITIDSTAGEEASLIRLTSLIDDLDTEDAREIKNHANILYGICWPDSTPPVAAIKKVDPARAVHHARSFRYSGTLRRVENPDLILSDTVDFVFAGARVGILRPVPFRNLLADTQMAVVNVPQYVNSVAGALASTLPITASAQSTLRTVATKRVSYARRLQQLEARLASLSITRPQVEAACLAHLGDKDALLDAQGQLTFDEANVALALDLLEGRLFEDDFSGEPRRADRWSRR